MSMITIQQLVDLNRDVDDFATFMHAHQQPVSRLATEVLFQLFEPLYLQLQIA